MVTDTPKITSKDLQEHLAADGVSVYRSTDQRNSHKEHLYGRGSCAPGVIKERLELYETLKKEHDALLAARAAHQSKPIKITLTDGKQVEGESWKTTPHQVAVGISKGLADNVVIAKVNNELWDLECPLERDSTVYWHSSAHMEHYYRGCLCYGPPIENGFYYDKYLEGRGVSSNEFPSLENMCKAIIKEKQPFERLEVSKDLLLEMFKYKFKCRILNEKVDTPTTTVYRCGPRIDLCRGPHVTVCHFFQGEYQIRNFTEVATPNIYNSKLCLMFGHRPRSWRELPLRFADFGVLHHNELAGTLSGLTRVRRFQQDDAHIFCTMDQIQEEMNGCLQFLQSVYKVFGFTFQFHLSTRPENYLGEIEIWDQAETCTAIQLDFQLPIRFNLTYVSKDGDDKKRPVIIHRAILGSVERMIAILCENYGGKWPFLLPPRQVMVIHVGPSCDEYAQQVMVGEKEKTNSAVNVRTRDNKVHGEILLMSAIEKLKTLQKLRSKNAEEEF
ncbi:hypothetical protein XELAEV_18018147mg [Xenopus laevis]|uniref:threonine--tRNA ligase n=1 Tax=Xenopus laevis TaxID=8355 RepID=A0A974HTD8_XENLA|nr:hypothetical protein XELAEV_18018147mg [Xenopus laevis]